jgi:hypothetical protein
MARLSNRKKKKGDTAKEAEKGSKKKKDDVNGQAKKSKKIQIQSTEKGKGVLVGVVVRRCWAGRGHLHQLS